MTDTLGIDLGLPTRLPSRSTESLDRLARTDLDGLTNEARTHLGMNPSPNATPAGGQCNSHLPGFRHDKKPHVYVVYWPAPGVLKIGMSTNVRWSAWRSRGAVEIVCMDVCCMPFAHRLEQWFLAVLRGSAPRAFKSKAESRAVLGDGVGWTECFLMPQSPLRGEPTDDEWDYARHYGLEIPDELRRRIDTQKSAGWVPAHSGRSA